MPDSRSPLPDTREALPEQPNPLGLQGLEFIEYRTQRPQALGQVLEQMGFRPVARHRSREVVLYRQGSMNIVIDAHALAGEHADDAAPPAISAVAFRVADARQAFERCTDLGAWAVAPHANAMELNIPAIQGPGGARLYFVDRWRDFSIFDIDFTPIPTVDPHPPALAGLHWFGVVQYIGLDRTNDWLAFFTEMLGLRPLPDEQRFGILPKGTLLRSPCGLFFWQLIEPELDTLDVDAGEALHRIGLGVPDVWAAVALLKQRGIAFVDAERLHPDDRGALTQARLGSVAFELVHSNIGAPEPRP